MHYLRNIKSDQFKILRISNERKFKKKTMKIPKKSPQKPLKNPRKKTTCSLYTTFQCFISQTQFAKN